MTQNHRSVSKKRLPNEGNYAYNFYVLWYSDSDVFLRQQEAQHAPYMLNTVNTKPQLQLRMVLFWVAVCHLER